MRPLVSEARHAVRLLIRHKSFAVTALTTIAVAIAANTLIFALVRGILLRPLPVPDSDRLVQLEEVHATGPINLTGATFVDLRARAKSLQSVAAFRVGPASVSDEVHAVQATAATVTADYFPVLGAAPIRGRLFDASDFVPNAGRTVIMSRTLWQRLFNADPTALGRDVLVNGTKRELVGIVDLPASIPGSSDVWLPYPDDAPTFRNRRTHLFTVIGHLAPGVLERQAASDLANVSADIQRLAPDAGALTIRATPLRDRIVRSIRPTLLVMWAAVLLLLTIAFANIANLVLTQGSLRAREMSIRTALGAGRWRLLRQLLIENGLLGTAGGVLGTMLGGWAVALVRNLLPGDVPRLTEVTFDPAVAAFGVVLSILCAIVFGAIPALRASLRDPMGPLRGRDLITGSSRLRGGLVAAEVALTLTLLAGAGLLARTLMSVSQVRMGFDPLEVVTIDLSLPSGRYGDVSAQRQFYERALERVRAIGGVGSAAVTGALPLTPTAATGMQPQDGVPNLEPSADVISASDGIFSSLRIPLRRGRVFDPSDRAGGAPVAVVSESAAREFWPAGTDPIGRAITMRDWGEPYRATVIGIVGDVHQAGPDRVVSPTVYYPFAQFPETTLMQTIVVRTNQPTDRIVSSVRDIVHGIDRDQPIAGTMSLTDRLAAATAQRRVSLMLLGAFAIGALLMAAVGVYGVVAFAMASRTREIGVRMALGATGRDIARLGALQGAGPVLLGVLAGIGGMILGGRALRGLLFGVGSNDPSTLVFSIAVVALVTLAAVVGPTRRATRIDPLQALRAE